jgi:hypothetical protein
LAFELRPVAEGTMPNFTAVVDTPYYPLPWRVMPQDVEKTRPWHIDADR